MQAYNDFLSTRLASAPNVGFSIKEQDLHPSLLWVRCFTFSRGYFFGWIVQYITNAHGDDYAEIAPEGGGPHCYLYPNAVEGYERLW